jgi:hypothetical protein
MFGQLFRLPRAASVAALAAASCCVVAAPASASQNQVAGVQSPGATAPACADTSASYTMTGGLVGCWYEDTGNEKKTHVQSADGKYEFIFTGTEHFTGCLDTDGDGGCSGDPTGSLYFTYTFTGQYDLTFAEIRGRCHHPIVSGTGDFAGATGVINFKDDIANGTSPYMGHVGF